MTDAQWYTHLNQRYDAKAAELMADGWEVRNEGQRFVEHYERNGEKIQIVRKLGSDNWQTRPYTEASK